MHVVIRAGGVGSRLWPVSRRVQPKQFHVLVGSQSLFRDAYERARLCASDGGGVFVSCGSAQVDLVREQASEIDEHAIICEPCPRNTGPAMCLEAAILETRLDDDAVVCSMPSDDFIGHVEPFVAAIERAGAYVRDQGGVLVTPCVPADGVDTGFCYVEPGDVLYQDDYSAFFSVSDWVEKPSVERCQELIDAGTSFVHMGMYVYRLGAMIEVWERLHPALLHVCRLVARDAAGAAEYYAQVSPDSIESMVTAHEPRVAMQVIPELKWSDVGKWHMVRRLLQGDAASNVTRGSVYAHDTSNSLIYGMDGKATAVIGLSNVVVVDTADGLLVAHGDRSHEVKDVLAQMDEKFL